MPSRLLCDLRDSIFLFSKTLLVCCSCSLFSVFCKYFTDLPPSYRETEHTAVVGQSKTAWWCLQKELQGIWVVTARGYQNGSVVTVIASDKASPNSRGLGFVYTLGTYHMPAPRWLLAHIYLGHLFDSGALAASSALHLGWQCSDCLGKLRGTCVLQYAAESGASTDHSSLCSSNLVLDQNLRFRILLKPAAKDLFYWLIHQHAAATGLAARLCMFWAFVLHTSSMDEVRVSHATLRFLLTLCNHLDIAKVRSKQSSL